MEKKTRTAIDTATMGTLVGAVYADSVRASTLGGLTALYPSTTGQEVTFVLLTRPCKRLTDTATLVSTIKISF